MKIKGAIFDLDGTLLDSMFIWDTIGETYLRKIGLSPRSDLREALRTMSLLQAAEYFRKDYGVTLSCDEIMEDVNRTIEHFYTQLVLPKKGVSELLEGFQRRGIKMCIATATDRHLAEAALSRSGLLPYFEEVFTCTEVGAGKDSPDIFLKAWKSLGTKKEETFVLEDALFAIQSAKKAGFPIIGVFDQTAAPQQDAIKNLCDVYIKSFENIGELLP